jgi:PTH1 family peptidyl-tRNA hydrolase
VAKAVVGLGNPGARYARTRHNAGFLVVDRLAQAHGAVLAGGRHGALWAEVRLGETAVLLVEPQTFMNRSGRAVLGFARELDLEPADILVVHDELDLPLARTKLKRGGGTAGHRGLESVVEHLGTRDFPRLRVGIGRPAGAGDIVDFVLEPFDEAGRTALEPALDAAVAAVEAWCALGIAAAMDRVNAPPGPPAAATGA